MHVELAAYTPNAVNVCETSAAFCYDSKPTKSGAIVRSCVESGHESVTEHASFTFYIFDISRACLAQLTRHRIGTAFSVRSQRYCNERLFGFITPPTIRYDKERADLYGYAMGEIRRVYNKLVDLGVPKEDARFVLPNACATSLSFTVNIRELIHLCNLRLCNRAQWEFRDLVTAMVTEVVKIEPTLAPYLVPNCERLGYCPEKRGGCGKKPTLAELVSGAESEGYFTALAEMERDGKADNGRGNE